MKNNHKAFTLVELIVVITILAVLATVGFISMQGYASSSRDSVRLTDMTNISKGFNLKLTKGEKIPLPENSIQITASGTLLSYQGDAGKTVLGNIGIHGDGVDPIDETYYTYTTNANRNKYQILGFLENNKNLSLQNIAFSKNTTKYGEIKGGQIGVIVDSQNKSPIHVLGENIELTDNNHSNKSIIFADNTFVEINQDNLNSILHPNSSCKNILKIGAGKTDGVYSINHKGATIQVYCDMTTDGGGWTLFYANNGNPDSQIQKSYSEMRQDVFDDTYIYDIKDYNEENLAGLIDYRVFTANGYKEILATNRDFFQSEGRWLKLVANSSETLNWLLGVEVLGNQDLVGHQCNPIINNGFFGVESYNGDTYENNYSFYSNWGANIGISSSTAVCNGYENDTVKFGFFYSARHSDADGRTRFGEYIGGDWRIDNQFRYFIR